MGFSYLANANEKERERKIDQMNKIKVWNDDAK